MTLPYRLAEVLGTGPRLDLAGRPRAPHRRPRPGSGSALEPTTTASSPDGARVDRPAGRRPADVDLAAPLAGLLVDEWTEVVPSRTETAGLAFRYDPPDAMAPQAMLLAVPPDPPSRGRSARSTGCCSRRSTSPTCAPSDPSRSTPSATTCRRRCSRSTSTATPCPPIPTPSSPRPRAEDRRGSERCRRSPAGPASSRRRPATTSPPGSPPAPPTRCGCSPASGRSASSRPRTAARRSSPAGAATSPRPPATTSARSRPNTADDRRRASTAATCRSRCSSSASRAACRRPTRRAPTGCASASRPASTSSACSPPSRRRRTTARRSPRTFAVRPARRRRGRPPRRGDPRLPPPRRRPRPRRPPAARRARRAPRQRPAELGTPIAPGDAAEVRAACAAWMAWVDELFSQPAADEQAWQRERMEYAFSFATRTSADPFDEWTLTAEPVRRRGARLVQLRPQRRGQRRHHARRGRRRRGARTARRCRRR